MSKINWEEVRDAYVTGEESFATLARRLGVSKRAVEQHAAASANLRHVFGGTGESWGQLREAHRTEVSRRRTEELVAAQAAAAVATQQRHVATLEWLFGLAKANLEDALKRCAPKEKLRFGLAILALERRVHGLDRVHVEVAGKDGGPIQHDIGLDDETAKRAQQFLEAIFGEPARTEQRPALRAVS